VWPKRKLVCISSTGRLFILDLAVMVDDLLVVDEVILHRFGNGSS